MKEPKLKHSDYKYQYIHGVEAITRDSNAQGCYGHKTHLWYKGCGQYIGWVSVGHRADYARMVMSSDLHVHAKSCEACTKILEGRHT